MELFRTFRDLRRRRRVLCRNHEIMYATIRARLILVYMLLSINTITLVTYMIASAITETPLFSMITGIPIWFHSGIWFGVVWMYLTHRIIPKYEILCECLKTDTSVTPGNTTSRK